MTRKADPPVKWWNSLRVRLLAIMSLALLPIGLIAIDQTRKVTENARRNSELALLALVEGAALQERLAIQRAFGAATSIVALYDHLQENAENCSGHMAEVVARTRQFSFAGIVPLDGIITCSSADQVYDLSQSKTVNDLLDGRKPQVIVDTDAPISKTSVISVSLPIEVDGEFVGLAAVSVPHSSVSAAHNDFPDAGLVDLVTFSRTGEIFTTKDARETLVNRLPRNRDLVALTLPKPSAFSGQSNDGRQFVYTVGPVEDHQLYVLGIWDAKTALQSQIGNAVSPSLFPALMWITSLIVVILAIHRLVLRHIRNLRRQMLRFARDRTLPGLTDADEMPNELQDVQSNFTSMAYSIMHDEARLEDSIHEKNVLIREIHHRVKNNLQLISSIVNMHIRDTSDHDTRAVLHRIQDRVLSLATIHRDLYQTNSAGLVNVGHLVAEIVQKSADLAAHSADAIELKTEIDNILLYPDQAVPMSLLASEVVTNALKYGQAQNGQASVISVTFKPGEGQARIFQVSNARFSCEPDMGTGMGGKLINAFAIQLGATVDIEKSKDQYTITVAFDASDFVPEPGNY